MLMLQTLFVAVCVTAAVAQQTLTTSEEFVPCHWTYYECQSRSDDPDWSTNCYGGATSAGSCYQLCGVNPESGSCLGYCEEFLSKCTTTQSPETVPTIAPTVSPTVVPTVGGPSRATTTSPTPSKEIHDRSGEFVPCQWTFNECQSKNDDPDWSANCYRGATGAGSCYDLCSVNLESGSCLGYCGEFLSTCTSTQSPETVPTIAPTVSSTTSNAGSPSVAITKSPNSTKASSFIDTGKEIRHKSEGDDKLQHHEHDYTRIEAELKSTRFRLTLYRTLFYVAAAFLVLLLGGAVIYYYFEKKRAKRTIDSELGGVADSSVDDIDCPSDASHIELNEVSTANGYTAVKSSPAAETDCRRISTPVNKLLNLRKGNCDDTDSDTGLLDTDD